MEWLVALLTLTVLEIVLGIDNIVFISILAGKLPPEQQGRARTLGLGLAMVTRLLLLFSLTWLARLTAPLFAFAGHEISGRDLIMLVGGLFLLAKATFEIHDKLEGEEGHGSAKVPAAFWTVIAQILALDIVFSLDSVITAVGMAQHILVMVIAMVIAVGTMLVFARRIGDFVNRHPSMKILALSFLLLIGVMLVAESLDQHINKAYIYFAMAFSLAVELMNMRFRKKRQRPVKLHEHAP
jgi:predicted tellurium resistance membrane protein TerC